MLAGSAHTFFSGESDKPRAGELINVLREAKQPVPDALLAFGTTVKKKESKLYGAHFKVLPPPRPARAWQPPGWPTHFHATLTSCDLRLASPAQPCRLYSHITGLLAVHHHPQTPTPHDHTPTMLTMHTFMPCCPLLGYLLLPCG